MLSATNGRKSVKSMAKLLFSLVIYKLPRTLKEESEERCPVYYICREKMSHPSGSGGNDGQDSTNENSPDKDKLSFRDKLRKLFGAKRSKAKEPHNPQPSISDEKIDTIPEKPTQPKSILKTDSKETDIPQHSTSSHRPHTSKGNSAENKSKVNPSVHVDQIKLIESTQKSENAPSSQQRSETSKAKPTPDKKPKKNDSVSTGSESTKSVHWNDQRRRGRK